MTSRTGHYRAGGLGSRCRPQRAHRRKALRVRRAWSGGGYPPRRSVPGLSLSEAASVWSGVSQSCFPNNTSRVFIKQNMIMILAAHSRKDVPTGTHLGSRHRGWGTHGAERPHTASPGALGGPEAAGGRQGPLVCGGVSLLT